MFSDSSKEKGSILPLAAPATDLSLMGGGKRQVKYQASIQKTKYLFGFKVAEMG